jgi:SEC-C motif-containing protein
MAGDDTGKAACPCASGRVYAACCQVFHAGHAPANAELLMRSRYTAYVLGLESYLLDTWQAQTRPAALDLDADRLPRWLGLEIRSSRQRDADHAEVEFVARYRIDGRAHRLHETSRFVREDGRWYYVDGDIHAR